MHTYSNGRSQRDHCRSQFNSHPHSNRKSHRSTQLSITIAEIAKSAVPERIYDITNSMWIGEIAAKITVQSTSTLKWKIAESVFAVKCRSKRSELPITITEILIETIAEKRS